MSAKPDVTLSRWADLAGSFVTDAPSGLRDTGFLDGTPAAADIVNAEIKQLYLWALYLNDGVLTGNHSVDGDVVVAGTLTAGGRPLTFTDFTFTADSASNQCAKIAHGLQTGDGPVRTANSGGALPGGLTAGTDYWIICNDTAGDGPNLFRLATSRVNALTGIGVAIDITSNGTGTQTLQHQAGTTRISDARVTKTLRVVNDVQVGGSLQLTGGVGGFSDSLGGPGGDISGVLRYRHLPAQGTITGTVNDWNPVELDESSSLFIGISRHAIMLDIQFISGTPVITGLVGGADGRIVTLTNVQSTSITLSHDTGSTAQNRFFWPTLANLTLALHQTITIWYSSTASRWKLHSKNF